MTTSFDRTFPLPLALLERPTAIVGATGSGKTYVAKGAVEQLLGLGRRVDIAFALTHLLAPEPRP